MRIGLETSKSVAFLLRNKSIFKLVLVYPVLCFVICLLISKDTLLSLYTTFLISVISIYLFALIETLGRLNKERMYWAKTENLIRNSFKNEYNEIYKKNKRTRLLNHTRDTSVNDKIHLKKDNSDVHLTYLSYSLRRGNTTDCNSTVS